MGRFPILGRAIEADVGRPPPKRKPILDRGDADVGFGGWLLVCTLCAAEFGSDGWLFDGTWETVTPGGGAFSPFPPFAPTFGSDGIK